MHHHGYSRLEQDEEADQTGPDTLLSEDAAQRTPAVGLHHTDFDSQILVVTCLVILVPALTGLVWWLTS